MGAAAPVDEELEDEEVLLEPENESKLPLEVEVLEAEAEAALPELERLEVAVAEPDLEEEVELLLCLGKEDVSQFADANGQRGSKKSTYALAAAQNWVTWFWTDDLVGSLGQLL
ncbi:uncharacterized protein BKCO1_6900047 [Diplodia corticola]|uniref:Uncharacterized protein n=1 Tax=Diplodia corticola TaxID=236234 RepID=A0A1J9RBU3_9PEZI|nr:uncharacterized protein BKCO1_6900047 [Diplodia corticola]OJD29931.1 hypothetical protein BKCO1_6900047 [Diplodia corticola]